METKRTIELELTDDLAASVTIERLGQQPASHGDGVIVLATIRLPIGDAGGRLAESLRFGERVAVAGEFLSACWGARDGAHRWRACEFTGPVYAVLFGEAEAWARAEVHRLTAALAARSEALLAAG